MILDPLPKSFSIARSSLFFNSSKIALVPPPFVWASHALSPPVSIFGFFGAILCLKNANQHVYNNRVSEVPLFSMKLILINDENLSYSRLTASNFEN